MPKCPDCETDNDFVYVGITRAECPNQQCRNYDRKAYAEWVKATQTHPNEPFDPDKTPTEDEIAQADAMAEMYKQYLGMGNQGDEFD